MIMVDPKRVELSAYAGIPHLLTPIITDPKKAAQRSNGWSRRWMLVTAILNSSDSAISRTSSAACARKVHAPAGSKRKVAPYPYILVVVDEMADLMMVAKNDVEAPSNASRSWHELQACIWCSPPSVHRSMWSPA